MGLVLQFTDLSGHLQAGGLHLSGQYGQFHYIWAHARPQWFERKTSLQNHGDLPDVL